MTTPAKAKPIDKHITYLLLVLAVLGVLLILVSTSKYGAGCSTDCVHYVSTARNLLSGKGYFAYGDIPFVEFPPLFPTFLALTGLIGIDPFITARYVNAICFGLIVLISGLWLLRHIRSRILAVLGSLAILFSIPLIDICVMAMSDPLFIVFALLFILEMELFLSSGKSLPFFAAALFAVLACMTRYIGATVVLTGLVLLLIKRDITFTDRLVKGIVLTLICALPMSVWILRNYAISDTLAGGRESSSYTLLQNLYFALDVASAWFVPPSALVDTQTFSILPRYLQELLLLFTLPPLTRIAISIIFLLLIAWSFSFAVWRDQSHQNSLRFLRVMPMFCYLPVYTGTLISILTVIKVSQFPPISSRFLSPVFVPLVSLIFFAIDLILQVCHKHFSELNWSRLLIAGSSLLILYPFLFSGAMTINHIRKGAGGYSHISYHSSPTVSYLQENTLDGVILSNSPDGVYFLTGLPARLSPTSIEDALSLRESLASNGKNTYLVWFDDGWGRPLGVGTLASVFEIETVEAFSDATVYLVE